MVRGPRGAQALAERRRAERILRSRLDSQRRLRGFLFANNKYTEIRNKIRMRKILGRPIGNLRNRARRAYLALQQEVESVKKLRYVMVSTVAEMRTLVEFRRDFGGWEGSVSVDPRATRFTRYEIRRIVGEEDMNFDNYRP